jgi:hypothetical protein
MELQPSHFPNCKKTKSGYYKKIMLDHMHEKSVQTSQAHMIGPLGYLQQYETWVLHVTANMEKFTGVKSSKLLKAGYRGLSTSDPTHSNLQDMTETI